MAENIFDDKSGEQKSILDTLVGEGKKFKTVEDLAIGKVQSDEFIEQLQTETAGLREDLGKRVSVEEAISNLKKSGVNNDNGGDTSPAQLSPDDIQSIVTKTLTETQTAQTYNKNLDVTSNLMTEKFGEKAAETLQNKAQSLNLSVQELKDIAGKSPDAFKELMGLTQKQTSGTPQSSGGTVNTELISSLNSEDKDGWEYYEKLRKTNPTLYWKPATQNEMHAKMAAGTLKTK